MRFFSGANSGIIKFAEKLNIPIATTIQGKANIPTNHCLCLGVMGVCGHKSATNYISEEADLLIAVGTIFNEFATLNWDIKIAANKKLIQIDPEEIGKNSSVDIGLIGDTKIIVQQLLQLATNIQPKDFTRMSTDKWDLDKYENTEEMPSESIPLKPQRLMRELRDSTPDATIFLGDVGSSHGWVFHNIPIYQVGEYLPNLGTGSMGARICTAIGVKVAKPEVPVVCVCGDGSFQM